MRYRITTLAVAGGVLLAAAGAVLLPSTAQAAAGCQVAYTTNDWPGGFTAAVTVTNLGDPVSAWTLGFAFANGQQVT